MSFGRSKVPWKREGMVFPGSRMLVWAGVGRAGEHWQSCWSCSWKDKMESEAPWDQGGLPVRIPKMLWVNRTVQAMWWVRHTNWLSLANIRNEIKMRNCAFPAISRAPFPAGPSLWQSHGIYFSSDPANTTNISFPGEKFPAFGLDLNWVFLGSWVLLLNNQETCLSLGALPGKKLCWFGMGASMSSRNWESSMGSALPHQPAVVKPGVTLFQWEIPDFWGWNSKGAMI